ncbi:hypothetical protein FF041_22910 [Streptomyces jumonjinensis]|uniref:Uncharacterized protein n=1 Tax=Streptomyces jumonjinensis TaxID=1945 RepID=A0A646KL46_STRJU|nr:hypothetical protein [Streptomyces jumonjinensis]
MRAWGGAGIFPHPALSRIWGRRPRGPAPQTPAGLGFPPVEGLGLRGRRVRRPGARGPSSISPRLRPGGPPRGWNLPPAPAGRRRGSLASSGAVKRRRGRSRGGWEMRLPGQGGGGRVLGWEVSVVIC